MYTGGVLESTHGVFQRAMLHPPHTTHFSPSPSTHHIHTTTTTKHTPHTLLPSSTHNTNTLHFGPHRHNAHTKLAMRDEPELINCLPSANLFDNSAPQLAFSKNNELIKGSFQLDAAGMSKKRSLGKWTRWYKHLGRM